MKRAIKTLWLVLEEMDMMWKIGELNIPTGIPLVYEFSDDMVPLNSYYLGDSDAAQRAARAVADQLKPRT